MKKLILLLSFIAFSASCFAAVPIGAISASTTKTADAAIKTTDGYVHSVLVSYAGVTAGDKIELQNGAAAASTVVFSVVAPAANGSFLFVPASPVYFSTAIYYDETKSGGTFTSVVQYS